MLRTTLTVDHQRWELDPAQDLGALRREIVDAVAGAPRFVDLVLVGHALPTVAVLVTSRATAHLEHREVGALLDDEQPGAAALDPVSDLDLDLGPDLDLDFALGTPSVPVLVPAAPGRSVGR